MFVLLAGGTFAHWRAAKHDEILIAKNIPHPVKNLSTTSQHDLADIPPEAFVAQPPTAAGYNAHSGGLPPGALPPGVVLPGMPVMQGGRATAQGYGVYDGVRQQFTGKERDGETGLDYFGARYYSAAQGRFTSPDPENAGANISDPQSWNGYAYARNNPLRYVDPDGRKYKVCRADGSCEDMTDDQFNQMKNNPSNGELGVVVKGGKIYNRSEGGEMVVVGLYQRTSFDDQNDFFNGVIFGTRSTRGLVEQAPMAGKTAMVLWGGSVVAGATGGAGLYALGSGGSGLTTLGTLGQVATPAAGTGAAVLNQLSRTDASIFQQASQFGASATNAFMSNVSALAQAVASKIPGGQINVIGQIGNSPIYGSVVSRVGIAQVDGVTVVVKMVHGQPQVLGPLP